MKIYLSGPMRGKPGLNFRAFDEAASMLRSMGHTVFNPVDQDRAKGFKFEDLNGTEDLAELGFDVRAALAEDCVWITKEAEAVAVLPGWHFSYGALAEVYLAQACRIPVGEVDIFDDLGPIRELPILLGRK